MPESYFGPRLSGAEYDRLVTALHERLPDNPDRALKRFIRRKELDLAIDHRLGRDFPADRREALWRVSERIDKKRRRLVWRYFFLKLIGRLGRQATDLADLVIDEYSEVLSRDELEQYFGPDEVSNSRLPIDGVPDRVESEGSQK